MCGHRCVFVWVLEGRACNVFVCVAFQHDLIYFVEVVGDFDAALCKFALRAIFYMMRVHAGRDS